MFWLTRYDPRCWGKILSKETPESCWTLWNWTLWLQSLSIVSDSSIERHHEGACWRWRQLGNDVSAILRSQGSNEKYCVRNSLELIRLYFFARFLMTSENTKFLSVGTVVLIRFERLIALEKNLRTLTGRSLSCTLTVLKNKLKRYIRNERSQLKAIHALLAVKFSLKTRIEKLIFKLSTWRSRDSLATCVQKRFPRRCKSSNTSFPFTLNPSLLSQFSIKVVHLSVSLKAATSTTGRKEHDSYIIEPIQVFNQISNYLLYNI